MIPGDSGPFLALKGAVIFIYRVFVPWLLASFGNGVGG